MKEEQPENSPVVWFVVLERARLTNDFELAARARRQLESLGVKVTYLRPRAKSEARLMEGGAR